MEREIKIISPDSLKDVNLAVAIVFGKVMKIEGLSDIEKVVQILAAINNEDVDLVRQIPLQDLDKIGGKIIELFSDNTEDVDIQEYYRIDIDGTVYGLEPDFNKMELGAYIDMIPLLEDVTANIHRIMAILYRPVEDILLNGHTLTKYSIEGDADKKARQDLFLKKMPYSVARAVANFMLASIQQ